MRLFDYKKEPEKLLTPEIVQMVSSIHEHKGRQALESGVSGVQFMKSLQSKMFILWTERSATLPERW